MTKRMMLLVLVAALVATGCSSEVSNAPTTSRDSGLTVQNDDCIPTVVDEAQPRGGPDRRIENIVEALTGERQTTDEDPVADTIDDPNFGGVWGDRQGGIVVAVLDCTPVDANQLAFLAGGSEFLHLIEVPHTFHQVDGFRDALVMELQTIGIAGDVYIQSTLTGRLIEVHVLDPDQLPESFGDEIPAEAFTIVKSEGLIREA